MKKKEPKKRKKNGEELTWCFYGIPLTKENLLYALFFIAIIVAVCIVSDAIIIPKDDFWVSASLFFLMIVAFLYHYAKSSDLEDKDREIAQLKQEIKKLESIRKTDEQIIELLKKQIERYENES